MRAVVVAIVTFILSMVILVNSYHALERSSVAVVGFSLSGMGFAFGMIAGSWEWIRRHPGAFLGASYAAAMMILLPMVLNSYGGALILLPFVLLWMGTNLLGLFLIIWRMQSPNQNRARDNSR